MASKAGKKASDVFVWILMALLLLGLGGFGISSFTGGGSEVGAVGDRAITAQEYLRALDTAVRARAGDTGRRPTLIEAEAEGIPLQVRAQLAGTAALAGEADRIGLSVGDDLVGEQIVNASRFHGVNGSFDREVYEFTLTQNGYSVREYEQTVREETARALLQGAVVGGVTAPEELTRRLVGFLGERRSFRWISYSPIDLSETVPEPSEEELQTYYAENELEFTLPQSKAISYAWLAPSMLADEVSVDEATLQALYNERIDEFVRPERRLVERLVYPTADEAVAAKAALDAEETEFEALVAARGLTLQDIDLGEVAQDELGVAGADVFALDGPGVVGPFATDLGPALFRMNAVLEASEVSFDVGRLELSAELQLEGARRMIDDLVSDLDDRLAGGATLEDLAAETDMVLGEVDWGLDGELEIMRYEAFRQAADSVSEDDFPEIIALADGGVFALRLNRIDAPRLQPFDEVLSSVRAGWEQQARLSRLREQAQTAMAQLEVGNTLEASGRPVRNAGPLTRDSIADGAPPLLVARAFELDAGGATLVDDPAAAQVHVLVLDDVLEPDLEDARIAQIQALLASQAGQGLADDLFQLYARALTNAAGISFNNAAITAVNSQVFQ